MGINKKVIERNMFFGAKAELFPLALYMGKNPTDAERACGKYSESSVNQDFHFADNIRLNSTLLAFIVIF